MVLAQLGNPAGRLVLPEGDSRAGARMVLARLNGPAGQPRPPERDGPGEQLTRVGSHPSAARRVAAILAA
jgi:hypothetical protein